MFLFMSGLLFAKEKEDKYIETLNAEDLADL